MTEPSEDEGASSSGVKVVGATSPPGESSPPKGPPRDVRESVGFLPSDPKYRGRFVALSVVSVLGMVATLVFGLLWANGGGSGQQDQAVISSAKLFLNDFFNFDAKTVDHNFSAVASMATGTFAGQAKIFFNSAIRTDLEKALAESRGQIRNLYVQSDSDTGASVYAVIDQVYANNKISTPQTDVVRIVVNLEKVGSTWKISDVTVLEGATPASGSSASGSAGSAVPGQ